MPLPGMETLSRGSQQLIGWASGTGFGVDGSCVAAGACARPFPYASEEGRLAEK